MPYEDFLRLLPTLRVALKNSRRVLLTGPSDSDGDSLGATLALKELMEQLPYPDGAREIRVVHDGPWDRRYRDLPGMEGVEQASSLGDWRPDLAILCDGVRHRIGAVGPCFDQATHRVLFDHHRTSLAESNPEETYTLELVVPDSASTCEMVYALAESWDLRVTDSVAHCLYVGIIFDTGTFRYSCTRPGTHRVAAALLETGIDIQRIVEQVVLDTTASAVRLRAHVLTHMKLESGGRFAWCSLTEAIWKELGAQPGDQEGLVNDMLFVQGVEVAALLTERGPTLKLSLRSRGRINVAEQAQALSAKGGGHDRAAGATLEGPFERALERAVEGLKKAADALDLS